MLPHLPDTRHLFRREEDDAFLKKSTLRMEAASTHSLALHRSPLPAEDVLQLGEMLDEGHHLGLEALGVDVLHRGHLQQDLHVKVPAQVRISLPVPDRPGTEEAGSEVKQAPAVGKRSAYL